jgi:hypothetical protein
LSGALPTSVILDSTTGVISGTPSVTGTFNFTVRVTDAGGLSASQVLSIVITTTSGTAGCGALNGGVAPYDQSTCGNVGASFSPVGTNIGACQTLSAGSYTLNTDVVSSSGNSGVCFTVTAGVTLNLGGHTVTGTINSTTDLNGLHIYNGTVNCGSGVSDCLLLSSGMTISTPMILEYVTSTNSSTGAGGRVVNVDWSGSSSLPASSPSVILRHLTLQAPPIPTSPRTINMMVTGANVVSDIHDNLLTCPPNASACQGVALWNNAIASVYNNKIVMADTRTLPQDGRAIDCDGVGAGGATVQACDFRNNYIVAANNRAFRYRGYSTTALPGPFNIHDNLVDNVANTTEGMMHFCDPDYGTLQFNNANTLSIYSNTFIFGPNALGIFTRDCAQTGPVVHNNTIQCAAGGCGGASLATVSTPLGTGGSTSNLTLKNNALNAAVSGITVHSGGTANYCNTGTCSGAGTCNLLPPPCN